MEEKYKENKLGLIWMCILFLIFIGAPYYGWLHTSSILEKSNKQYEELKKQINYTNKLLNTIEDLTVENQNLAISKNEYIGKYCAKVDFKTKDCTDYIKAATKATIDNDKRNEELVKKIFGYDE